MRIICVNIAYFGKLKDVAVTFDQGMNVFRQVNGFGKTTLANFIRAMLYGFNYTRVKGVTDAGHFAPWGNNERFGGSMTVEHNGEKYRIERFFGGTAKQETRRIFNEQTGKEENWQQQPGEILLGLTAESYDRSAYFPQESVTLESNDNLDARLANLVQNSAEDYNNVQEKLRNYKKNLRYERGNGGRIYDLEQQRYQLEQQLNSAEQSRIRLAEIDARTRQISDEKELLVKQKAQHKAKTEDLQRQLALAQPGEEEKNVRARLSELDGRLSRIPREFDADFAKCDDLARQITATPQVEEQATSNKSWLFAVGAVLAIVGVVLVILGAVKTMSVAVGVALGVVAIVGGAICAVFGYTDRQKHAKPSVSTKNNELISQYISIASKYVYVEDADFETVRRALWDAHVAYKGDIKQRETLLELFNRPKVDTENLKAELEETERKLSQVDQRISDLTSEAVRLEEERKRLNCDTVSVADNLLSIDAERNRAEYNYRVAETVSALLEQAKDNLSSSYLPRLCKRTTELLQEITQSKLEATVDRSFAVSLREKGLTKPMSEFSRGTREITLLCFRVALSELLYDGHIPFLIVDDAFVNFDENNFLRATDLLNKIAEHAQVVYLTCHKRTGNLPLQN